METVGGGSLGWPLDGVYIHQVPQKNYLGYCLLITLETRGPSLGFVQIHFRKHLDR